MTRGILLLFAGAFALFAAGTVPARAGEVAMETLKIQNEGVGKAAAKQQKGGVGANQTISVGGARSETIGKSQTQGGKTSATGDPDRPLIIGSPPNAKDAK